MIDSASQGWHRALRSLIQSVDQHMMICSPFVGQQGTTFITENLPAHFSQSGNLTFLTNLSVGNVCQLATDPRALRILIGELPASTVFHVPGLHAKVYIADERQAIVTSANLTAGGLYRNLEFGVVISDPSSVRSIRAELFEFANLGASVPFSTLVNYCDALNSILESVEEECRSARNTAKQRFQESLRPIDDELIRLRLTGVAVHTLFARTIEYLLRNHGAMTTVQIHPMIAAIHPDLCDDSIDRVIDGKRFGKKWKHAVRTAQQQLKKQGSIDYAHGIWRLNTGRG